MNIILWLLLVLAGCGLFWVLYVRPLALDDFRRHFPSRLK